MHEPNVLLSPVLNATVSRSTPMGSNFDTPQRLSLSGEDVVRHAVKPLEVYTKVPPLTQTEVPKRAAHFLLSLTANRRKRTSSSSPSSSLSSSHSSSSTSPDGRSTDLSCSASSRSSSSSCSSSGHRHHHHHKRRKRRGKHKGHHKKKMIKEKTKPEKIQEDFEEPSMVDLVPTNALQGELSAESPPSNPTFLGEDDEKQEVGTSGSITKVTSLRTPRQLSPRLTPRSLVEPIRSTRQVNYLLQIGQRTPGKHRGSSSSSSSSTSSSSTSRSSHKRRHPPRHRHHHGRRHDKSSSASTSSSSRGKHKKHLMSTDDDGGFVKPQRSAGERGWGGEGDWTDILEEGLHASNSRTSGDKLPNELKALTAHLIRAKGASDGSVELASLSTPKKGSVDGSPQRNKEGGELSTITTGTVLKLLKKQLRVRSSLLHISDGQRVRLRFVPELLGTEPPLSSSSSSSSFYTSTSSSNTSTSNTSHSHKHKKRARRPRKEKSKTVTDRSRGSDKAQTSGSAQRPHISFVTVSPALSSVSPTLGTELVLPQAGPAAPVIESFETLPPSSLTLQEAEETAECFCEVTKESRSSSSSSTSHSSSSSFSTTEKNQRRFCEMQYGVRRRWELAIKAPLAMCTLLSNYAPHRTDEWKKEQLVKPFEGEVYHGQTPMSRSNSSLHRTFHSSSRSWSSSRSHSRSTTSSTSSSSSSSSRSSTRKTRSVSAPLKCPLQAASNPSRLISSLYSSSVRHSSSSSRHSNNASSISKRRRRHNRVKNYRHNRKPKQLAKLRYGESDRMPPIVEVPAAEAASSSTAAAPAATKTLRKDELPTIPVCTHSSPSNEWLTSIVQLNEEVITAPLKSPFPVSSTASPEQVSESIGDPKCSLTEEQKNSAAQNGVAKPADMDAAGAASFSVSSRSHSSGSSSSSSSKKRKRKHNRRYAHTHTRLMGLILNEIIQNQRSLKSRNGGTSLWASALQLFSTHRKSDSSGPRQQDSIDLGFTGSTHPPNNAAASQTMNPAPHPPHGRAFWPINEDGKMDGEDLGAKYQGGPSKDEQRMISYGKIFNGTRKRDVHSAFYDAYFLDTGQITCGERRRKTMALPGYRTSFITFVEKKKLKKDLNAHFYVQHPSLEVREIKLTQLRKIRYELLYYVLEPSRSIDISTAAYAYWYFERLAEQGMVDKTNRKVILAACVLLAIKFLGEDTNKKITLFGQCWLRCHKQGAGGVGRGTAVATGVASAGPLGSPTAEEKEEERVATVDWKEVLHIEFSVFVGLDFTLFPDKGSNVVMDHVDRLLLQINVTSQEYFSKNFSVPAHFGESDYYSVYF